MQIPLHKLQKSKKILKLPKILKFYTVSKMENVNIYLITNHYCASKLAKFKFFLLIELGLHVKEDFCGLKMKIVVAIFVHQC